MDNIIRLNRDLLWQQERNNNVLRRLVDEDERRIARENADSNNFMCLMQCLPSINDKLGLFLHYHIQLYDIFIVII